MPTGLQQIPDFVWVTHLFLFTDSKIHIKLIPCLRSGLESQARTAKRSVKTGAGAGKESDYL